MQSDTPASTKVLLVEDSPGDRDLICEMLGEAGEHYEVTCVAQLTDAVAFLGKQTPDVVLLDLNLPDATGMETVRRATTAAPDVPIVVLTGREDEAVGISAVKEGAQDFLGKNDLIKWLARTVRYAIARRQLHRREKHLAVAEATAASAREKAEALEEAYDQLNRVHQELKDTQAELLAEKEKTIAFQRATILALSTPVIQIWKDIVVLPLIGDVDTRRASQIMDQLLNAIAARRASVALVDITGVPVVDTTVATHLTRAIRGAKMLGARCLLTGLSPQTAQTLVNAEVNIQDVETKGTLEQGLAYAFRVTKRKVVEEEQ